MIEFSREVGSVVVVTPLTLPQTVLQTRRRKSADCDGSDDDSIITSCAGVTTFPDLRVFGSLRTIQLNGEIGDTPKDFQRMNEEDSVIHRKNGTFNFKVETSTIPRIINTIRDYHSIE